MVETLNQTKDIFVDTVLINDDILIKKIKNNVNNVKISIVLNSYRKATNLKNIIDNLLQQTFKHFELIVVDDLVNNDIENIFEQYNNYENINYIKKQLGSKSSAKNIGLDYSRGEYVIFIEEDIVNLEYNYLEVLYNKISKTNSDIVILANATNLNFFNNLNKEELLTGSELITLEVSEYKHNSDFCLTSFIFKKQFLNIYNLHFNTELLLGENIYFKLQCFDVAKKINICNNSSFLKKHSTKSKDNQQLNETLSHRMLSTINKIEKFSKGKKYNSELLILCGYLYLQLLAENNKDIEKIVIKEINSKKDYFKLDSFFNKFLLNISPKIFANYILKNSEE